MSHILVIDDDLDLRVIFQEALRAEGYKVSVAAIQSGGLRCAGVVSLSASAEMPRGLLFGKPHQISVSPGAPDEQTIRLLVDVTCSVGK
jgi:hypothetical protein